MFFREINDAEIVRELINKGADINWTMTEGYGSDRGSTIGDQLSSCSNLEVIKVMIDAGFDFNSSGQFGPPLVHYAETDEFKIVKLLLNSGANVNVADKYGRTPVQAAAARGNSKMLKLLIDSGGKVNVTSQGVTPLFEAILGNEVALAFAVGTSEPNFENIRVLIDAGANVNAVHDDKSLLDMAYERGYEEAIKMLEDAGATK